MIEALIANAAMLLGAVLLLWVIAVRIGDVSFIDAFWGGGMALLAALSWLRLSAPGPLADMIAAMAVLWGARLAIYLFRRWRREGEDARYARMLGKAREQGKFASAALTKVFLGQALLLFLVSSPAQVGILAAGSEQPISGLALCGLALWTVGVFFEWTGDWQLARFRADPANKGQVMERGLWRYTRHPNYFGDVCAWWGIWLAAASAAGGPPRGPWRGRCSWPSRSPAGPASRCSRRGWPSAGRATRITSRAPRASSRCRRNRADSTAKAARTGEHCAPALFTPPAALPKLPSLQFDGSES